MSDLPIIAVQGIGKRYRLTHQTRSAPYRRLSDVLMDAAIAPLRWLHSSTLNPKPTPQHEDFWALQGLTFDIARGEVVGIIGHNGAGKSTLLKLLSRITDPSEGRMTLRGSIASLLEVGTGFHPELTGRENVFLNGAILGMTRAQVSARFNEIIAFAEIEKFLDTPVKRYSSGMYLRLAFAVAAHLEPEVLIIDELLAVGDAAFQQKCLGKMEQVAQGNGRTVLFVSHNLSAVSRLCTRVIVLNQGRIVFDGPTEQGIAAYTGLGPSASTTVDLTHQRRPQTVHGGARLTTLRLSDIADSHRAWIIDYGTDLAVDITVQCDGSNREIETGIAIHSSKGFELASWTSAVTGSPLALPIGTTTLTFRWRDLRLVPGTYTLSIGLRSERGFEDYLPEAVRFEVVPTPEAAAHGVTTFHGCIVPTVDCHITTTL